MAARKPRPALRRYPRDGWVPVGSVPEELINRALDVWPSRWDLLGIEREKRLLPKPLSEDLDVAEVLYMPSWLALLFFLVDTKLRPFTDRRLAQESRDDMLCRVQRVRAVLDALQARPEVFLGLDDVRAVAGVEGLLATFKAFLPQDPVEIAVRDALRAWR